MSPAPLFFKDRKKEGGARHPTVMNNRGNAPVFRGFTVPEPGERGLPPFPG